MSRDRARLREDWGDERPRRRYSEPTTRPRRSPPSRRRPAPPPRPQKRRSVWPWLLMGCAGGVVLLVLAAAAVVYVAIRGATGNSILPTFGNPTEYTAPPSSQQIPLSTIQQIHIENQVGNVTIAVDPNATTPTVTSTKKVKALSSDAANKEFSNITVQTQPPGTTAGTLAVTATVPGTGSVFSVHNDSVDLFITLPPITGNVSTPPPTTTTTTGTATPLILNVNVSIGDVKVSGLSGTFQIKDDVGNIDVAHATLLSSPALPTSLQTGTGNVTFNGSFATAAGSGNTQSLFSLQCETGNVTVTLPANTNVILDAYTNAGTISSDFDVSTIKNSDGSLHGPLITGTSPTILLNLHVSTGNISLHRAS